MFDAWACACPILLSIDGEARVVLQGAQAGRWVEPEDAAGMAAAVGELRRRPAELRRMGENGRRFVATHYSRQARPANWSASCSTGRGLMSLPS